MNTATRTIFRYLLTHGPTSRINISHATGIRKMTIVNQVRTLIRKQWLTELPPIPQRRGRPEIPVAIDTKSARIIGLSIQPHQIQAAKFDLLAQPHSHPQIRPVYQRNPIELILPLTKNRFKHPDTVAAGLTFPGLLSTDPTGQPALARDSAARTQHLSLIPLINCCDDKPLFFANDTQALAARWIISGQLRQDGDAVMVHLADGRLGAALIVNGRPVSGAASGASELGHTKLAVDTEPCYCGGRGCLERIVSSQYLSNLSGKKLDLSEIAANFLKLPQSVQTPTQRICQLLGIGLSNVLNLTRTSKLVIAGPLAGAGSFMTCVNEHLQKNLLGELSSRLQVQYWPDAPFGTAQTAAYATLAGLFFDGWAV